MKILVIGGSGFIGTHLVNCLNEEGHDVTVYDLKKSKNISANQKYIIGNILDEEKLDDAIKNVEYVYLFASIADIEVASENPSKTAKINIIGTINTLESCKKHKIKKIIFASSVYVYSRQGGFYRCSKQSAEIFIEEYYKAYNLNYTIFRYGS